MFLQDCNQDMWISKVKGENNFHSVMQTFKLYISPFMIGEKLDLNCRRLIMYLSLPKGLSVNDGVLKETYLELSISSNIFQ